MTFLDNKAHGRVIDSLRTSLEAASGLAILSSELSVFAFEALALDRRGGGKQCKTQNNGFHGRFFGIAPEFFNLQIEFRLTPSFPRRRVSLKTSDFLSLGFVTQYRPDTRRWRLLEHRSSRAVP